MELIIKFEKMRQHTEKELNELQENLDVYRSNLYSELRKLEKEKADVERRRRNVVRYEDFFQKQEQRLLVVATVATLFLLMGFAYVELGSAQFGNLLWLSTAGVLGLFLLINLVLYLLDRFGVKDRAMALLFRTLIHIVKSPLYLLRAIAPKFRSDIYK